MTARPRNINKRIAAQGVRALGTGQKIGHAGFSAAHAIVGGVEPGASLPHATISKSVGASTDALEPVLAAMDERTFQGHVRKALEDRGWAVFVVPDMRKTRAGLPDLLALHPKHPLLLSLELKTMTGKVEKEQEEFRAMAVRVPGVVARIVRPADWRALRDEIDDLEARWRHACPSIVEE